MFYQNLLVLAVFILFYSLFAVKLEKTLINGPLLALLFGFIVGPLLFKWFNIHVSNEIYQSIAELSLALVLFTDASNANLKVLEGNIRLPSRLLLIGLPLTILFGWLAGYMLFDGFSWIEIGILAIILAPTDAALGKAVVTNPKVPAKLREALNVESGLNDGICVPFLFLFIALFSSHTAGEVDFAFGLGLFVKEIGIGLAVGLLVTYLASLMAYYSSRNNLISESWKSMVIVSLAFVCFALAQSLGGSGFIACFSGGLLYGAINGKHKLKLVSSAEGMGDTLSMLTWVIFGSMFIYGNFNNFSWEVILYAVLSLTVVRMLPVLIALFGADLKLKQKLFMGWFGPRGLASIVFAIIVLDINLPHLDTIFLTVMCTILLSVILHGFTAIPLIKRLNGV